MGNGIPGIGSRCGGSSQRGVAAVEFAIVSVILFMLAAGVIEFGRALWYYDALAKATRDAARHLSTVPVSGLGGGSGATDIVVQAAAAANVPGFAAGNVALSCAPTACGAAAAPADVNTVTVGVAYPMTIGEWMPFFPGTFAGATAGFAVTLSPHTTMRYMW